MSMNDHASQLIKITQIMVIMFKTVFFIIHVPLSIGCIYSITEGAVCQPLFLSFCYSFCAFHEHLPAEQTINFLVGFVNLCLFLSFNPVIIIALILSSFFSGHNHDPCPRIACLDFFGVGNNLFFVRGLLAVDVEFALFVEYLCCSNDYIDGGMRDPDCLNYTPYCWICQ